MTQQGAEHPILRAWSWVMRRAFVAIVFFAPFWAQDRIEEIGRRAWCIEMQDDLRARGIGIVCPHGPGDRDASIASAIMLGSCILALIGAAHLCGVLPRGSDRA